MITKYCTMNYSLQGLGRTLDLFEKGIVTLKTNGKNILYREMTTGGAEGRDPPKF